REANTVINPTIIIPAVVLNRAKGRWSRNSCITSCERLDILCSPMHFSKLENAYHENNALVPKTTTEEFQLSKLTIYQRY
ncbi:MAG: hypothetical protein ABIH42_11015, partial [Planctomycetota bacterium]